MSGGATHWPAQAAAHRLRDEFWHLLCHRSELPEHGDFLKLDWLGEEVVVCNDGGDLLAFDNLCPHRGTRFFTAPHGNGPISCPYHGWSYAAGRLHIPCRERYPAAALEGARLNQLQLDWCGDFVFAAPAPRRSLAEQLGQHADLLGAISFELAGRADFNAYAFECDWRVALENALEPQHLPFVHPDSLNQLQLDDGDNSFTPWTSLWRARVGHAASHKKLQSIKKLFHLEEQFEGYQSLYLFPFTMLSSTFGYSHSLQHFFPSDQAGRCHFSSRLLKGVPKSPAAGAALAGFFAASAELNRRVFEEDHAICQRVARGAADNPRFGVLSDDEAKLRHFRACQAAALAA